MLTHGIRALHPPTSTHRVTVALSLLAGISGLLAAALPTYADCGEFTDRAFRVDATASPTAPPPLTSSALTRPDILRVSVRRGSCGNDAGCRYADCTSLSQLNLELNLAFRAVRDWREYGYKVVVSGGAVPNFVQGLEEPVTALDGIVRLQWSERLADSQRPIEFSIALVEINRRGRSSDASASITIRDAGAPATALHLDGHSPFATVDSAAALLVGSPLENGQADDNVTIGASLVTDNAAIVATGGLSMVQLVLLMGYAGLRPAHRQGHRTAIKQPLEKR